mmetsp:Transcript_20699/g.71086  ORF Transcript_20699/g.71086 Transcript_20699/m.71086 type:complete len:209 (-) Transcript_20699:190-816(-)
MLHPTPEADERPALEARLPTGLALAAAQAARGPSAAASPMPPVDTLSKSLNVLHDARRVDRVFERGSPSSPLPFAGGVVGVGDEGVPADGADAGPGHSERHGDDGERDDVDRGPKRQADAVRRPERLLGARHRRLEARALHEALRDVEAGDGRRRQQQLVAGDAPRDADKRPREADLGVEESPADFDDGRVQAPERRDAGSPLEVRCE